MSFAPLVLTRHDHTVSVGWKLFSTTTKLWESARAFVARYSRGVCLYFVGVLLFFVFAVLWWFSFICCQTSEYVAAQTLFPSCSLCHANETTYRICYFNWWYLIHFQFPVPHTRHTIYSVHFWYIHIAFVSIFNFISLWPIWWLIRMPFFFFISFFNLFHFLSVLLILRFMIITFV